MFFENNLFLCLGIQCLLLLVQAQQQLIAQSEQQQQQLQSPIVFTQFATQQKPATTTLVNNQQQQIRYISELQQLPTKTNTQQQHNIRAQKQFQSQATLVRTGHYQPQQVQQQQKYQQIPQQQQQQQLNRRNQHQKFLAVNQQQQQQFSQIQQQPQEKQQEQLFFTNNQPSKTINQQIQYFLAMPGTPVQILWSNNMPAAFPATAKPPTAIKSESSYRPLLALNTKDEAKPNQYNFKETCNNCCGPMEDRCSACCDIVPFLSAITLKSASG